jgi:hypothetical protein
VSSITYKLVFEGKIAGGQTAEDVKRNLISLFKSNARQIERLFSNPPVVIKRGINHATALKYQKAFERAGALCRIVRDKRVQEPALSVVAAGAGVSNAPEENRMICPMCNHEQEKVKECIQCGTVIHKYFEKEKKPPAPIPTIATHHARPRSTRSHSKLLWISAALILLLLLYFTFSREENSTPITHGPGMVAPYTPEQETIVSGEQFSYKDYQITPLATFQLEARVLSKKQYRSGRESDLSPVDLALGWGPMSDETVLEEIRIRQSNRFYHWKVKQLPIPRKEIEQNSANMHIIPADQEIREVLKNIRKGHVVEIEGYLVKVNAKDGWWWQSSLTRMDTGGGACEVIWVEEMEIK